MARVGFDLGASALQCITLTPTADNEWFYLNTGIYSNKPNPNVTLTLTLNVNVSLADGNKC